MEKVAIDPLDANALRYAGMMGHEFVVIHTYTEGVMTGPSASSEVNSLDQARKWSGSGDRIYQQVKRGVWRHIETVA